MKKEKKESSKKNTLVDGDPEIPVIPLNPMLSKFSKFDSRQSAQAQENYSKDIHVKKNKIFRGVR